MREKIEKVIADPKTYNLVDAVLNVVRERDEEIIGELEKNLVT